MRASKSRPDARPAGPTTPSSTAWARSRTAAPAEAVHDERARGRQADELLEAFADLGQLARCGQRADASAAEDHAAAQEAMPGGVAVEPQELFA